MSTLERVKRAAAGRWLELLPQLGGVFPEVLDGNHHPCPRCGGTDRFRLLEAEAGALFCNQCFREKNGDGIAALQWLQGWSFEEALRRVADRLGIEPSPRGPDARLEWYPWNETLAFGWARHKPGVSTLAVQANGGRLARWKGEYTVVALPIHRAPGGTAAAGWVLWNSTGGMLRRSRDGEEAKVLVTKGSKAGWIGHWALERLAAAELVWKVEGPSDMLALWSAIPEDLRERHLVVSNAFGAGEKPRAELLEVLRGRRVALVGDNDQPGQEGAARWAAALVPIAAEVLVARLPDGSKDVRDWLVGGGTYASLLALAVPQKSPVGPAPPARLVDGTPNGAAPPVDEKPAPVNEPVQDANAAAALEDLALGEADDDPSRLAREYVRLYRGRIASFLEEVYYWRDGQWGAVPESDLRQQVYPFVHKEFQRVYRARLEEARNREGPPIRAHKISLGLITSMVAALKGYCGLPSTIRWGTELGAPDEAGHMEGGEERRWISCKNGVLDVTALLEGRPQVLRPHSPTWWSPHQLPYACDPRAGAAARPRWEAVLARNLEGDSERISQLQEWAGYCLLPETSYQRFLIVEGEGANGKSVYLAVLEALLGPKNVAHVPLELWSQRFALTPTLGKLANIASEVGDLDRVAEGYLKAFVAGDPMTFDRKGREAIDACPTARLVIATNNRPRFSDRSKGLWRRMLLVPFKVEIPQEERVVGMDKPEWWYRSGEMPAVLNWALEGLQRLLVQGRFTESAASREAIKDYQTETNPAREFLEDAYEEVPNSNVQCLDAYKKYAKWCEENGYRPLASRTFGKEVKRVFPTVSRGQLGGKSSRQWVYSGLTARVEASEF